MTVTVTQQKLVLNAFAAQFQNNLIAADVVTWKEYDTEMNDRNGLQVIEQVGPRYAIQQTVDGVKDLSSGVQDTVFGSEIYKINRTFNASMGWGDFVKIRDIGDARESEALKNAATNLAETIDSYILSTAILASNNWTQTAGGVNVADYSDVASAYTRLKEQGVGDDGLSLVLSYADRQALSETVVAYTATDNLSTGAFRKGFSGEVNGIPTVFTQQLPAFTTGSRAGGGSSAALVNGGTQNSNYKDVATSGAPGQYLTQTIAIDTLTGSQTLADGDVFTIANVYEYDNRAQVSTGRLMQFRVVGTTTASSGAVAALRIFPAIIVPGTGSGGDINVNTAHATVDSIPADNAAITFVGAASTVYRPRALIQKDAITVCTAPLIMPATGIGQRKALSRVPLSVRMWQHSDFATGNHSVRFDVALTANVKDRRRVIRMNAVA